MSGSEHDVRIKLSSGGCWRTLNPDPAVRERSEHKLVHMSFNTMQSLPLFFILIARFNLCGTYHMG